MRKTLEIINLLILSLLTHLVGSTSNNLLLIRAKLAKKNRIIKEVLGAIIGEDKVTPMILL